MKIALLSFIHFGLLLFAHCYTRDRYDPLLSNFNIRRSKRSIMDNVNSKDIKEEFSYSSVYVGLQDEFKDVDKISALPGQPTETDFNQYSGYVTIDPEHGKSLFYYFVESPINTSTNPLVLWLQGGPGFSSMAGGAVLGVGPFRVNPDNTTLSRNKYAWNNVSNVLFLESPAGVGFSYSNTTSDYEIGDAQTAKDSYTFLVNWLERFKEYKTRDLYIAGQSYAGHYVPQLAQLILQNNKTSNQTNPTIINFKGITLGNAYLDDGIATKAMYEYFWTHALIPDELYKGIVSKCNFSEGAVKSWACKNYMNKAENAAGDINIYDIYAPRCSSKSNNTPYISTFDPCAKKYVNKYFNNPKVQNSLHAKPTKWESCNNSMHDNWKDMPFTVLDVVQDLMANGIRVWLYSGDTDSVDSVIESKYYIHKLQTSVKTPWYPWMYEDEVGGYAVEYKNLTFVTVRGAGHSVYSYQPARALSVFTSFLKGKLP